MIKFWCLEDCPLSGIWRLSIPLLESSKCITSMGIAVRTLTVVRYTVDVCYWKCLLMEVLLYLGALLVLSAACSQAGLTDRCSTHCSIFRL